MFMNETVRDYCLAAGVEFTRCRPYRKNDQAWVEQKNGSVVRRAVGYRRFEGLEAAAVLARLYGAMRLFVNFFQPSFKLAAKARDGAKVTKRYHAPATLCERLMADARTSEEVRRRLETLRATLDPVRLLQQIRAAQQELVGLADALVIGDVAPPTAPTLEQFLSGCAPPGGRARFARPAHRSRRQNACGAGPIRLWRSRPGCGNGSRWNRGAHRANCLSACRQNIPACIRMGNCEHASAVSRNGGGSSIGIRVRADRRCQPRQPEPMPGCGVGGRQLPCGFAAALGRR